MSVRSIFNLSKKNLIPSLHNRGKSTSLSSVFLDYCAVRGTLEDQKDLALIGKKRFFDIQ